VKRVAPWLAALALGLALVISAPAAAPAREQAAHVAGVTVSFGPGQVVHRTVTFTGDSITGLDALRGAGFDIEVYGFSGIGGAVCRIDGVGRTADSSCLNGGSEYWAYWHDGTYSSVGAGASQVHDRDQEQWAWGSGDHAPPTTAFGAPTTTRPATTTTAVVAPPGPDAGDAPVAPRGPGDRAPGSPTTTPASSTTAAGHGSTTASTTTAVGDAPDHPVANDEEVASETVAHTSRSGGDGGGGGGPLAIAGFVIVLAAVVGLTLRARSARGSAASRN
jgi:hypothetical protein